MRPKKPWHPLATATCNNRKAGRCSRDEMAFDKNERHEDMSRCSGCAVRCAVTRYTVVIGAKNVDDSSKQAFRVRGEIVLVQTRHHVHHTNTGMPDHAADTRGKMQYVRSIEVSTSMRME